MLEGFGQDVSVEVDARGRTDAHDPHDVLKLFLIDPKGIVREIYSLA